MLKEITNALICHLYLIYLRADKIPTPNSHYVTILKCDVIYSYRPFYSKETYYIILTHNHLSKT